MYDEDSSTTMEVAFSTSRPRDVSVLATYNGAETGAIDLAGRWYEMTRFIVFCIYFKLGVLGGNGILARLG